MFEEIHNKVLETYKEAFEINLLVSSEVWNKVWGKTCSKCDTLIDQKINESLHDYFKENNEELLVLKVDVLKFLEKVGPDTDLDFILDLELKTSGDICELAEKLAKIIIQKQV
jgi:thiol-disulfide isomerase/thioredoxin